MLSKLSLCGIVHDGDKSILTSCIQQSVLFFYREIVFFVVAISCIA